MPTHTLRKMVLGWACCLGLLTAWAQTAEPTKRPLMAAIACKYSDKVVLTSDNPRSESAEAILRQMQGSFSVGDRLAVEVDRRRRGHRQQQGES